MKSIALLCERMSLSSKTPSSRRLAVLAALAVSLLGLPPAALAADFDIPPDLGAYTVLSCQDMQMSGNSVITSEGVVGGTAGDGVAHVRSNGNIVLSGTVDIHGNVTAGPGKQVTTSGNPTVTGTKGPAASAYNCTPIDLTVLRTALEANNDNSRVPRTDKNRVALGGGDGRTLTMSGNDGLTLPAGTYLFSSISLSGSSQLRVSGQVRILVTGSVSVSGGSHINLNGNPFQMRLWTQGAVAISSQSNVHARGEASPTAARMRASASPQGAPPAARRKTDQDQGMTPRAVPY